MNRFKRLALVLAVFAMVFALSACGDNSDTADSGDVSTDGAVSTDEAVTDGGTSDSGTADAGDGTRVIIDHGGREVEIPEKVESIVCVNVGALRYTCYIGAQDLVVGVEDYEQVPNMARLYNYVNFDKFSALPVIGTNGEHFPEAIIEADPDVIIMADFDGAKADELYTKTGIPVVLVPGSDTTLDEGAYETIRIMGEVYGMQARADELIAYFDSVKADLAARTEGIAEADKPSVYVSGVSFKGYHGFDGTEAFYGPLALINANNLADTTGQPGAFNIDVEQVLDWDPDIIFVDFNGLDIINEDYAVNPAYYDSLTAVQQGKVFSQISFRSSASNLDTALADAYYAATVIYPEQFADIDIEAKTGEIFEMLLGTNPYDDLKESGYEFRAITIGE